MLDAFKDAKIVAPPDGLHGEYFASIEAWDYGRGSVARDDNLTFNRLSNSDVEDWALQKGRFHRPATPRLEGGFRLLLAQAQSNFRATIPESLASSNVLDALGLPACTLASFRLPHGTFSTHCFPEGSQLDDCERLRIILRTPQKWECTVGGLAISHDFSTGITTAMHVGYIFELDRHINSGSRQPKSLTAFLSVIRQYRSLWAHPLVLPNLFLVTHVLRVTDFVLEDLNQQVMRLEYCIGVTKSGRSGQPHLNFPDDKDLAEQQMLYIGEQMQRHNAKRLTEEINDLTTKLEFTRCSPQWDYNFSVFLLKALEKSTRLEEYRGTPNSSIRETLEYIQSYSDGLKEVVQSFRARMELQLNILYTSIAQDDGQTSARLAASTGKDSTSMKIIALITAAYLPGTFVATLLSMDMFNWKFGQGSDVSKDFWIYWAVAVPLTILTLSGWALWWKFEKTRFERDVQKAVQQQQSSTIWQRMGTQRFEGLKSHIVSFGEKSPAVNAR